MSFTTHVAAVSRKAAELARAIGRLMPNIGGPAQAKRALLGSVVHSKLLYGTTVWGEKATKTAKNRVAMTRPQRAIALRILRAYRTVFTDAFLVLSSTCLADLLDLERCRILCWIEEDNCTITAKEIRREERDISIRAWQRRWDWSIKGRWTHTLLPDHDRWLSKALPISFRLTQALSRVL